uniref:TSA: Wollemia nobilis Ref_Wollemi_Transcript_14673_1533 transcribed RNA sequence n=1 Tax=Wollemia nobilis TaxID=56998 RepID=A0A0C9QPJ7_9CONI
MSSDSKFGRKEYISEVTIIMKLRHRNLVQILGWCHERGELFLVYEFLPNGSLDKYLFGEQRGGLDWERRYSIACDVATALVYLHDDWDQQVVHRDVKASNILLDSNFNAKLGDFGLARVVERNHEASHTTVVAGTMGYLAPECVVTGKATPELDVFSFGAVSLEIACGKRPVDRSLSEHNSRLVEWVWDLYGQGKILDAVDERLGGNFNPEEMERLMAVGLLCSHPDPKERPTMREVIKIFKFEAPLPYIPSNLPVAVYMNADPSHMATSTTSSYGTCSTINSASLAR